MLNWLSTIATLLVSAWALCNALLLLAYRRELACMLREPVFKCPVLVIESDDWGAGPLSQATALRDIVGVLGRHQDVAARPPSMSIALVLSVPDGPAIRRTGAYQRLYLDDARLGDVLDTIRAGTEQGVFSPQLHGLEHFWPRTLIECDDHGVKSWLQQDALPATEQLPAHLQSRWVDASVLPSRPLEEPVAAAAVAEEVEVYRRILGVPPKVVVPPTFVWTRDVERAWAASGIECVVTPGWRYTLRDVRGMPGGDEGPIVNGDRSGSIGYLARYDYFEPVRGRDAVHALAALERAVAEGRPCVLENHRDNFIAELATRRHSLDELDRLLRGALARHPDLRFMSSWELHRVLRDRDADWLVSSRWQRIPALWQRFRRAGRPFRLARFTGAAALGALVARLALASTLARQSTVGR